MRRGCTCCSTACDEVVIAQSCDKNFGVYRDRVGSLFLKTARPDQTKRAMDHVVQIAREMWSMPPDHGAAAVRIVLEDAALRADWNVEVGEMRDRINRIRGQIAAADPRLAYIGGQFGMFSMLPISREQVRQLREHHAIYMADSGRFNVIGMADARGRPLHRRRRRGDEWLTRWLPNRSPTLGPARGVDWAEVARLVLTSRAMDELEETRLVPEKKVLYQFSARGHDMAQVILGLHLSDGDAACGYYRSRPMLLALGVPLADALGSGMGREGGYSDGRDIGVVFNYPNPGGAHALPMCGGVGAQYTPAAGWAQAIAYKAKVLGEKDDGAIAVVLGGDASCATGGFWSALTIATTQSLPLLFYIEDNGYGISVPSDYQTPGRDIAANLASFKNLAIWNGDGTEPAEAARLIGEAIGHVRSRKGPALIRLTVPRLEGHSFQDTQTYKSEATVKAEWARDPLPKLKAFASDLDWGLIEASVDAGGRGGTGRSGSARRLLARPGDRSRLLRWRGQQGRRRRGAEPGRHDRGAAARRPADQHGHRHPPRARPGTGSQSQACWCSARMSAPRAASMR